MAHSNTVQLHQASGFSLKLLLAIRDFVLLLASVFSEARAMEQKSDEINRNW